jgi:hypothetical protein
MNIVIAMETLYQHAQSNSERGGKSDYIFAFQKYSEALEQFREEAIEECQPESSRRAALIFSLLVTCFEENIDNNEDLITQALAGVALLLKWITEQRKELADDLTDDWSNLGALRRLCSTCPFTSVDGACRFCDLACSLVSRWCASMSTSY